VCWFVAAFGVVALVVVSSFGVLTRYLFVFHLAVRLFSSDAFRVHLLTLLPYLSVEFMHSVYAITGKRALCLILRTVRLNR